MPESVPVRPHAAGEHVAGRYALEAPVDTGTHSPLYRAFDTKLQRVVAIELLAEVGASGVRRMRFERAAAAVAALAHPNIVALLDHGTGKEGGYLVSEWPSGESLAQRTRREPLTTDQTLSVVRQLLAALASLHSAGITHRNISPSTVFVQRGKHGRQRVKLLGLGAATLGASALLTEERAVPAGECGAYAAPELTRGARQDPRSDVYAVGAILAEALAHVLPDRTLPVSDSPASDDAAPEPQLLKPTLGVALQALIARATAEDPKLRFADAAEMLCELVDGLPRAPRWSATEEPAPESTLVTVAPAAPELSATSEAPPLAAPSPTAESVPPPAVSVRAERASRWQRRAAGALGVLGVTLLLTSFFTSETSRGLLTRLQARVASLADASLHERKPSLQPLAASEAQPAATDVDTALAPLPGSANTLGSRPSAVGGVPRRATPAVKRLASRNPWVDPVPTELQGLPALIATGADVDGGVIRTLRTYCLAHMDDPRGHLLLGHAYLNRLWRNDGLFELSVALRRDPTARGAPELLPLLLGLVVQGKVAEDASALVEKSYGAEALGAIEVALAPLKNTDGAQRLRALRSRLLAELDP